MNIESLRQYIKTGLEYGWIEANEYNNSNPNANIDTLGMGEDVAALNIFYAKTKNDFIGKILKIDFYNIKDDLVDDMTNDGYFEENEDVTIRDLMQKVDLVENYLPDTYIYSGEGYYDFWDWGDCYCERVDEIIKSIKAEVKDKELNDNRDVYKKEISDEYIEEKLKDIDINYFLKYLVKKNKDEILDKVEKSCKKNLRDYKLDSGWLIGMYYDTDGEFWDTTPMSKGSEITSQRDDYDYICVYELEGQCDSLVYDEDLGKIEEIIEDLEEFKEHITKKYKLDKNDKDYNEDLFQYINWREYSEFNNDEYEKEYENQLDYTIDEIAESAVESASETIDNFINEQ